MWRRVWIWERRLKRGRTYCLRWYDKRGRIRTETVGPDRKLAERLRKQWEFALNSGGVLTVKRIRYQDFVDEELAIMSGRLAQGTLQQLRTCLEHFRDICRPGLLEDVDTAMVEQFFSERLRKVARATANKELRHLKASFNRAVRRGYLRVNPAVGVKPAKEAEKSIRVLSGWEIAKLLAVCPSVRWKALVALAVCTGMRRGEILALRWRDVDLDEGTVWVRNTGGHETKSRKNRVLALPPEVCRLLRQLPRTGETVFGINGRKVRGDTVSRQFKQVVEKAGIEHCTLHDLRRTFVSHLAMAGVNAAVVQRLAGHASISTTVRYYTGIMPKALRAAQARLPFRSVLRDISDSYHGRSGRETLKTA